jgi:L-fucose mutarotase
MLKGLDRALTADLLQVLMLMGHGDDLLVCDVNHPAATIAAHTTHGRILDMAGCDIPRALQAILSLMPLDTFVEAPVTRMLVVGDPDREPGIVARVRPVLEAAEGRAVALRAVERFAFYEEAASAFAVVRTSDPGPYGCFILKKGVI